ncbi:hypothetical protein DL770_006707 [Monosporascus sp. CRB-9-2]|nr:hypothetical protein DL770_006707 [Monosporascus sp. CRB-9-2]
MAWSKSTRISIMLAIDVVFFLVELISGFMVHSLALMADAFHMLNDIISLIIGLWAVSVAQRATTDKYSYGFVRAEILGAFFNAVFLIALCISIILEALTRFIEPQEVSNPKLILIVGCCGLASNLVGFLVLGGHGHAHGHGEDDHSHGEEHAHDHVHQHDTIAAAEEGRAHGSTEGTRHIQFNETGSSQSPDVLGRRERERRRASSVKHSRLTSIEDLSIHPAILRQDIIAHSRSTRGEDRTDESATDEDIDESAVDERSPLIVRGKNAQGHDTVGDGANRGYEPHARRSSLRPRRDSGVHTQHNHNRTRSKSRKKGHGHGHDHGDMGMNGMILHVLGDALGNVGVIATALIIWLTEWPGRVYADPAVSLFITLIILKSAIPLTRATSKVLLQATPDHLELSEIKEDIQNLPGVISCHHVHVWQLSDTKVVASMHIQIAFPITEEGGERYMKLAKQARKCLHAYGIHSATIQPEFCVDESCNHSEDGALTLDGHSAPRCGIKTEGDVACLLECVDDCVGLGCCAPSSVAPSKAGSSRRSSSSAHDHAHNSSHRHEHEHH